MYLLWYSASPQCNSGYGKIGREVCRRLKAAGHRVDIVTKHPQYGLGEWEGSRIFPGLDIAYINQFIKEQGVDYIISLFDIWLLDGKRKPPKEKWIAYVPTDTNDLSGKLAGVCREAGWLLAMSRYGMRSLRRAGFDPLYTPHGIDTAELRPDAEGREAFRRSFGWTDENFVIGSVGLNYRDDRKGFIPLMQAFQTFHERHPEARLYIHTDAGAKGGDTIPFVRIANALGIGDVTAWPDQMSYQFNLIDEGWLRSVYNGMDVFCLPTRGEGFGIPAVDAQSCGVPVILSNNTTGPELCKSGWLIDTDDDDLRWLPNDAWRNEPRASAVLAKMEEAYSAWRTWPTWLLMKEAARTAALEYDWGRVWSEFWRPALGRIDERFG